MACCTMSSLMSRITSPTSSLISLLSAASKVSPTSTWPPATVNLSPHFTDLTRSISPLAFRMSAPTVGSGYRCPVSAVKIPPLAESSYMRSMSVPPES
ncbi:MAG TPA: hypothetical protein VEC02_01330 [Nitrososphaerales archaeon]|nr:hypothetical protein [Nitrososphaerales archaeon]